MRKNVVKIIEMNGQDRAPSYNINWKVEKTIEHPCKQLFQ